MEKEQHSAARGYTILVTFLVSISVIATASTSSYGDTLLSIKDSWHATLPTWISGTDFCKWEGVQCNSQGTYVIALNLTNKGLTGDMPIEIGNLASLESLDISYMNWSLDPQNRVTGDLSPLGSLTNLQLLNASFNSLNTGFPSSTLALKNLMYLRLDNTNLTGSFPEGISSLTNLKHLYLGNNLLGGDLPAELGSMTTLVELSLWNNPFGSGIPAALSNLVNLQLLNLHSCGLWGGLPEEFSKLKNLKKLNLYSNLLTGSIPSTWQRMQALVELRLEHNFLTLDFPSWMLDQPDLYFLNLAYNQIYGAIPNLSNVHLGKLNLGCNFFTGPWPIIDNNASIKIDGNCFANVSSDNDTSKYYCGRMYSCKGFSQQLKSGACPLCPTLQVLLNKTLCICGEASNGSSSDNSKLGVILGTVLPIGFLFIAFILLYMWKSRRQRQISKYTDFFSVQGMDADWEVPKGVQRFSIHELAKATNGFDKTREIGAGGFGRVFYGVLENRKKVAIKCASDKTSMRGSAEFHNEVILLSRLHHRNLVRLEGFCEDEGLQILVYEYAMNGNLHTWLFNNSSTNCCDWYRRLEIAVGIAQGLDYLHSFADPPVIHRDVKPSNILLNDHLVAKLSDFGLSKSNPMFQTHLSTSPAGTAGYMDPQYFLRQQLTTASDVYGFGVVLLELITGQNAIESSRLVEQNLVEWARPHLFKEGIHGIIDPRIGNDFPEQLYYELAKLAIKCSSFDSEDRPSMQEVVVLLEAMLRSADPPIHSMSGRNVENLSETIEL